MSDVDAILRQVASLNAHVKPNEAQGLLDSLMSAMGPAELSVWEPKLRDSIGNFHPKRRRALTTALEHLLAGPPVQVPPPAPVSEPGGEITPQLRERVDGLAH